MWLLEKIRGSVDHSGLRASDSAEKQSKGAAYSNVLTPDKIPDFFIPPKLIGGPGEADTLDPKQKSSMMPSTSEQNVSSKKPQSSPRLVSRVASESKNLLKVASRHIIQIESADDLTFDDFDQGNLNTNADPQSQTAMSLPYVPKTQTSYGFATLMESPHTRRKESLFHGEPSSPGQSPTSQRRKATSSKVNGETTLLNPPDISMSLVNPYRYFSGGDSDTCSSAESSPFSSPLLSRSASLLKMFNQEGQSKVARVKQTFARNSSLSTDECSSADTSPNMPRRLKSATSTAGSIVAPLDVPERLHKEHKLRLNKGGAVRLKAEYDASTSRLRIRIMAAEDLYDNLYDIKSINCCVSLYLNPGKVQKQRSTIIKNSRNPIFNEDFFFDGIPAANIKNMSLKLKVVNKGTSLKRDTLLGEKELSLSSLIRFS
ncbi:C2 calcium-dependent domain-containing protein 4C [Protopterus annectens]|uniref:C2 calcium-dependent domain-containing protein 4C n=1 Tax=Protopterus annectens TaxID=7888 RepID=UPI001CFAAD0D|nr:C2 calcium-dependent domain-containing protein 4C [Protopterus annectens]XP_043909839.1 C2 calcium-dependent domain-containing protein 4C [Protopterus annectens]